MSVGNPWVRVGKVPFGRGVFARQDIPAGTTLGVVTGKIIDDPDYASSYCIDLGDPLSLEPHAPFRYLKHCCVPNSHLHTVDAEYEDGTPAPPEVHVEALLDISKGEELTIDYQWAASGAIKCLCGSSGCRGWVVAKEELADLLKSQAVEIPKPRKAKRNSATVQP